VIEVVVNPTATRGGVTSSVTWQNPDVQAALEALFRLSANEKIVAVHVTDIGLQAYFDYPEDK
jgi:hypothetical protein